MSYEFRGGIRIVFNFTYVQLLGANQIDLKTQFCCQQLIFLNDLL